MPEVTQNTAVVPAILVERVTAKTKTLAYIITAQRTPPVETHP